MRQGFSPLLFTNHYTPTTFLKIYRTNRRKKRVYIVEVLQIEDRELMKKHEKLMSIAARSSIPVLLQGESGVGKEIAARFIHKNSPRNGGPFIALNCAAIARNLAESLLEGAKKGSYTGASIEQQGIVRAANGGTLFLDEIGEMPLDLQSKLLRILQERSVLPLGATQSESVDFRLVCATNRNLLSEIEYGNFRRDLFFRLNVFPIVIPPLRKRDDFADIAKHVWNDITARTYGEKIPLPAEQIKMLSKFNWPGNIRQLKNVLQRYALLKQHNISLEEILSDEYTKKSVSDISKQLKYHAIRASAPDWTFIQKALSEYKGNKSRAAKALNISRGSLCYQIRKHEHQNWDSCEENINYSFV